MNWTQLSRFIRLFLTGIVLLLIIASNGLVFSSTATSQLNTSTNTSIGNRSIFTGSNPMALVMPDPGINNQPLASTPVYPSVIAVSDLSGSISSVTVTLSKLNSTYASDLDVLLVAPGGKNLLLMSDVWSNGNLSNTTLTFDDAAAGQIPTAAPDGADILPGGSYRPTNASNTGGPCPADPDSAFPAPAPSISNKTTLAAAFNGLTGNAVNGDWALYSVDDCYIFQSSLAGGWSITIKTGNQPPDSTATPTDADAPSATPTGNVVLSTPTFTATSVGATSTPTATLTVEQTTSPTFTATLPVGSTELLINGGFEQEINPWVQRHDQGDKRKCDRVGTGVAHSGSCAFLFKGGLLERSQLQQVINLTGHDFTAGDTLSISLYVRAKKSTTTGKIKTNVRYNDGSSDGKLVILLGATSGYEAKTDAYVLTSGAVSKIKVQIKNSSPAGKLYIDDISLIHTASDSTLLPLP